MPYTSMDEVPSKICKRGHVRTQKNTKITKSGKVECLSCYARNIREFHKTEKYRGTPYLFDFDPNPKRRGMECPVFCKKCKISGDHNFYHDLSDEMESWRCRNCGTEHYAYEIPAVRLPERSKHSS